MAFDNNIAIIKTQNLTNNLIVQKQPTVIVSDIIRWSISVLVWLMVSNSHCIVIQTKTIKMIVMVCVSVLLKQIV